MAITPHGLDQDDIDIVRLVARAYTNDEIAKTLNRPIDVIRHRAKRLYERADVRDATDGGNVRVGLAAWAYTSGLMDQGPDVPHMPPELAAPLLELCRSIVRNQPRGDLRKHAIAALKAAGVKYL